MSLQTQSVTAEPRTADHFWYASYPPSVPRTIDPDSYASLPAMLLDACTRHASFPAFECLGVRLTYAEWEHVSRAFAAYLIEEAKFHSGDRIAIMLPNLLAYPVAFLGALRAGLIVVNVNPLYTPRELQAQLADCGATGIVIMENFAHKLEQVIGETQIRHVIVARLGDFMPTVKRTVFNFANTYVRKAVPAWRFASYGMLHAACSRAPSADYADASPQPTSPALLQYTGGTTGVAKAAILTHRNLVANTLQCRAVIAPYLPEEQGSVLTPLPLYHIFSLTANLLAFALMGGLSVLVPDPRDIKGLIKTIARTQVSTMTGVNTLFNALINNPDFAALDFSHLKFAVGGGAAVQSAVAERWREITGTELVEGYGLTEASPVVCLNPVHRPRLGTVGLPVPSTDVAIRDDHGNDLPVGEVGEICVRGPQVMQGYWHRHDESTLVLSEEGLAAYRRHRRLRPRRLSENPRPQEGHGQRLRLQGFSQRSGRRHRAASWRVGSRRHRRCRSTHRAGGQAVRRQARSGAHRSRPGGIRARAARRLQSPEGYRVRRLAAQEQCRQDHPQGFAVRRDRRAAIRA